MPLYRASGRAGFAKVIDAHPRRVRAAKLETRVQAEMVRESCEIATPEGPVGAKAGDAVVTDVAGDTWPVARAYFMSKYRPVEPTVVGTSGAYISIPQQVLALRMEEPFQVLLSDGVSQLHGHRGDWIVDSGDGDMRIVSAAAFARSYRIVTKVRTNFYQIVLRILLLGVKLEKGPQAPEPQPPKELGPLFDIVEPAHLAFDARAISYGNRYRSGFWAIYLLSALTVLCGVLPLALGWDSRYPTLHPYARFWTYIEVCLILSVIGIYIQGNRAKWRAEWLAARTTAELTWYLPLLAPLVDFDHPDRDTNWYNRIFKADKRLLNASEIDALCAQLEPLARQLRDGAWRDATFFSRYLTWAIEVFEGQKAYHRRLAARQHALLHRVHRINNTLFGLTAVGAMMHLFVHNLWLTLITTFFPSLAASLHGAIAQSEAYRLAMTSETLVGDLDAAIRRINEQRTRADRSQALAEIREFIGATISIVLQEHQAWHMLVRPHDLPLA
jgi:PGDYG protein